MNEDAKYNSHPGLRISRLLAMSRSPEHYRYEIGRDDNDDTSDAMAFGRLTHLALWEPDRYGSEVAIAPMRKDARTKQYQNFCAQNNGKQIITQTEHQTIMSMVTKLYAHHEAAQWLSLVDAHEVPIIWTHRSGRECKSKLDAMSVDNKLIVDLKTTKSCTEWDFGRSIVTYDYHTRAAYYIDAMQAAHGVDAEFVLIAIEKTPPHAVACYTLPEDAIESGRARYEKLLAKLKECEESDRWPGPNDDKTIEIRLPAYAYRDLDVTLEIGDENVTV